MIGIGRYQFDGPHYNKQSLNEAAGVYAVLDNREAQGYHVLDVGESEQIRSRLEFHDRENCWLRNHRGRICYAALYLPGTTQNERCAIEAELRRQYAPVCGVR